VNVAFHGFEMKHVFLRTAFVLLLLCLTQGIAAQRVFGGEDRQVAHREGGVCSLQQVLCGFVGKDLASLVEILLYSLVVTFFYFPLASNLASVSDFFTMIFSAIYCIWGMNHIWAISFQRQSAAVLGVSSALLAFLLDGMEPSGPELARGMGGYGSLLLLASPIRWAMAQWVFRLIAAQGSTYGQENVRHSVAEHWSSRGYQLDGPEDLACPDSSMGVLERWTRNKGFVCHSGQLFLLGFLFRFVAAACLLLSTSAKASGGQLPLGTSSSTRSRMLRDAIITFIAFLFLLELLVLGQTV